jgi:transcriptional regulator with XRE-family HTH domain
MRTTLKVFKEKALSNPYVAQAYAELAPAFALRKQLIHMRQAAGFTQEALANRLHTKKENISRLENVNSPISPKLSTIEEYAKALGYKLEINFIAENESPFLS